MPPKAPPQKNVETRTSVLESTFPLWSDTIANEKDSPDTYEDPAGLELPTSSRPFLDTWKRSQDLVLNNSNVPIVNPGPAAPPVPGAKGLAAQPAPSRELVGELFPGHNSFEWLLSVFRAVTMVQKSLKPGDYLWELIYPRDPKAGIPMRSMNGRYRIRLFIMDTWRCVVVDDRMPVDLFGRSLLVGVRPLALWPMLLCKAVLKVMAAYRMLDDCLPHQVTAFQMLTGWPQEDLMDPHSGTPAVGGFLADRLEDTIKGFQQVTVPHHVATCCLTKFTMPERNPPRIIAICGPSAVGKSCFFTRLLADYSQRFGITVSHTTRRPREHEENGRDFHFVKKPQMLASMKAGEFLENATVAGLAGSHYYGTSLATVRQVAATGKLCLMCVDTQGVALLRANKRVDGLYIYLVPPSKEEHERRIRGRLREAQSTITKRLQWAAAQVSRAVNTAGLFNHVLDNTEWEDVYMDLKEAISTLSPIIRNRLRGLPAYVLDYSDLIPPNSVEKPFLKPVVLSGPSTGERSSLLESLAREFPDVFAFPRFHTTRLQDEDSLHLALPGDHNVLSPEASALSPAQASSADGDAPLHPEPVRLSLAEFDAAVAEKRFIAHYTDGFVHPLAAHRHGVTLEDVREVIQGGRLPLLELEAEEVAALRDRGVDCLTLFLSPPSIEAYEERVRLWLSETAESVAARLEQATQEIETAKQSQVFDHLVVNDTVDETYLELQRIIARYRPDIIQPAALEASQQVAGEVPAPPTKPPAVLLYGPAGCGKEALLERLVASSGGAFCVPGRITDRRPTKGEKDTDALQFVKAEALAKLIAEGRAAEWRQEGTGKEASTSAVTLEALEAAAAGGAVPVIKTSSPEVVAAAHAGRLQGTVVVFVGCAGALAASLAAAGSGDQLPDRMAELQQAIDAARSLAAAGTLSAVVDDPDEDSCYFALRDAVAAASPGLAMPALLKPLVVAGPFASGKKRLLQRLFDDLPGRFGVAQVTTTRAEADGMCVITREAAEQLIAAGSFLIHEEVLGHIYGITKVAVKKVQAAGRIAILDLDRVDDVARLRGRGYEANYIFVGPESLEEMRERIVEEVMGNPPLGYEPEEAAQRFCDAAEREVQASREPGVFDSWVANSPTDELASLSRLSEVLQVAYPEHVPLHFVWGYGQQLWDGGCRSHGQRPLKVLVLGPAASGKSTLAELLAARFAAPHINVGELLYEEVRQATPMGLEAKVFMDNSKTVPDHFFIQLLAARLAQPDCVAQGWVLDGFPHTTPQVEALTGLGVVPDKVLMLNAEHALLLDRSRWRRIDYDTNKVYLIPGPGAASPAIQPLDASGAVDQAILARLTVRHDDSPDNVAARLKLYDEALPQLRASFAPISLRLNASRPVAELFQEAEAFLALEANRTDVQIIESCKSKEAQCTVVDVMRYQRLQLVQLRQSDGLTFWVELDELAGNTHCIILHQDPAIFKHQQQLRRIDLSSVHRTHLLLVDNPEPSDVLCTLCQGPQYPLTDDQPPNRRLLAISGPEGVGRSSIITMLLKDYPDKFRQVALVTTRPPFKLEQRSQGRAEFLFASSHDFEKQRRGAKLLCSFSQEGQEYGLAADALAKIWEEGCMAVVEGSNDAVQALKAVEPALKLLVVSLECELESLDRRMRQASKLHEQEIQHQLVRAEQVMAEVQAGTVGVDHVVRNDDLMQCYSAVRHLVSRAWPQPRVHCSTSLMLETFEWTTATPGPTAMRLHTRMGGASMLSLPRGRHLLRVHSSAEQLHAANFLSTSPFTVADQSKILAEHCGAHVVTQEGEHLAQPAGSWRILFRYNFHVTSPNCTTLCHVSISNQEMRRSSRVLLVNNDDLSETVQLLSAASPLQLQPNRKGYTVMALAECWQDVEAGPWSLTVAASAPLRDFAASALPRTVSLEGTYATNARALLHRDLITVNAPTQLGLCTTTVPAMPTTLSIMEVPATGALDWSQQYPTLLHRTGTGKISVPNLCLPNGRYLLQQRLDVDRLPVSFLPDTGELPGTVLTWQLVIMPSTDERACVITKDESQQAAFKSTVEGWGQSLVVVPPGKAATGKDRPKAAQAAMDRSSNEAASGAARAPELVRPLANKTTMALEPGKHLRKVGAAEPPCSRVLTTEAAAVEATRLQELVKQQAERLAAGAVERSGLRKANEGLLQAKGADFMQRRELAASKKTEAAEKLKLLLKSPAADQAPAVV